ncbi:phage antirepressor [Planococcus koreensis]|uniref:phage antirepressor n=1 Tax=Planococcus koreensis TaxID=112331 RepID=UPI0039FDD625
MNEFQKAFNYEGSEVRTVRKEQDIFFIAKDVCEVLDHSDVSVAVSRLDDDEKLTQTMFVSGQNRKVWLVNESGLYSLILTSRKPEAKKFKRWVTQEVLPSIRKHGTYMTPDTIEKVLADPDTIIQIATQLKEERLKRQQAELMVQEQKPKVLFADSVEASKSSILIRELAVLLKQNGINTGERRLYEWMRDNGYLVRRHGSDRNTPTQRSMNLGLFEIKETPINHNSGLITVNKTTKVTGKGQVYFINKFLSDQLVV